MNVLSLFDGISGAQQALKQAGIHVDKYFASEVDVYALEITKKNFPDTIQLGDVRKVSWESCDFYKIDLLIGGSPCQGFSFAGKQLNFEDPRSKLFFEYLRILKEVRPKYFLLENVPMKKEYLDAISDSLGVLPVLINSSLVSAQNRKRYYWTNINFPMPTDQKIKLSDIIENGLVDREKSYCIDANYFKGTNFKNYFDKKRRQAIFNYSSSGRGSGVVEDRVSESDKSLTLTATGYSLRGFTGVITEDLTIRKLTPLECERLQTYPDGYTAGVSDTQRYKALGNSFTVSVIAHILKHMGQPSYGEIF